MTAIIEIRDGRHPMAVLPMLAALIIGVYGVLSPPSPTSAIDRFVAEPFNTAYYGILATSGACFLATRFHGDIRARVLWERISLLPLAGALLVYPIVAWVGLGADRGALLEGIASLGFALGALARITEITLQVRWCRAVLR